MWPAPWVARIVNDGQNVNQIILYRIKNAIRKPWQECSAYAWNNFCVQKRNLFKAFELEFKGQLKLRAQPLALFLIPIEPFANFANGPPRKTSSGTPRTAF